jgi:hypothetical protein
MFSEQAIAKIAARTNAPGSMMRFMGLSPSGW